MNCVAVIKPPLANNPDLKFGQFVAANRIAKNHGDRNPNITTGAILQGLADGKSIGQRLQELGLSSKKPKTPKRRRTGKSRRANAKNNSS